MTAICLRRGLSAANDGEGDTRGVWWMVVLGGVLSREVWAGGGVVMAGKGVVSKGKRVVKTGGGVVTIGWEVVTIG